MSYIGTEPKDIRSFGRTQFDYTASQGQTAFTGADDDGKVLAFTTGQINVFVNGILMDDSDFTTTGTGTVTLASAANLNDIISIVSFESNIPDNDYVPASGGTFSGNVTHSGTVTNSGNVTVGGTLGVTGATTMSSNLTASVGITIADDNNLKFGDGTAYIQGSGANDRLKFIANNTEHMRVHSSGYVTMPNQPVFVAHTVSTSTLAHQADAIFSSTFTNRGNIYNTSNGRFTAPVAGFYAIGVHIRVHSSTPTLTYHRISFKKNGSFLDYSRGKLNGRTSGDYSYVANYLIVEMAVNDYITPVVEANSSTTLTLSATGESTFYGHLIG